MTKAPILVKANIDQPVIVTTDVSGTHVGGVLTQVQADVTNRDISYFSRKLKEAECRYSVIDKEALAVVLTCRLISSLSEGSIIYYSDRPPTLSHHLEGKD